MAGLHSDETNVAGAPALPVGSATTFATARNAAWTPDYTNINNYVDGFVDIGIRPD